MSFVYVELDVLTAVSTDLGRLGLSVNAAAAAAAGPTTGIVAAAPDEVSTAVAALFGSYGRTYQGLGARVAEWHREFVLTLNAAAQAYARAEAANVELSLLNAVNAPTQALLGRPLIGNGADGLPGTGQPGGAGGRLYPGGELAWVAGATADPAAAHIAAAAAGWLTTPRPPDQPHG